MHYINPILFGLLTTAVAAQSRFNTSLEFDYIIAGGGTAGLLLATILSEDPAVSVLVLEAGGDGRNDFNITVPENRGNIQGTTFDWALTTTNQSGMYQNSTLGVPRGKVLGGTSAMNWMIHNENSKVQLDLWESLFNLNGWNWNTLSTAFREQETFYAPPPELPHVLTYDAANYGGSGPISSTYQRDVLSMFTDFLNPSMLNAGYTLPKDRNGGESVGGGFQPLAIHPQTYTRSYSGSAYTAVQERTNLVVQTYSQITKVNWIGESTKASGLEYVDTTTNTTRSALGQKVILSGGIIGTPQILENSGVGNSSILSEYGIETKIDLPAVGTSLRDPLGTGFQLSWKNGSFTGGQYVQNWIQLEPASTVLSPSDYAAASEWLNSTTSVPGLAAIQFEAFKKLWFSEQPLIEFFYFSSSFVVCYNLVPLSQGTTHVQSSDPLAAPRIDPNYNSVHATINGTEVEWDLWFTAKAQQYYSSRLSSTEPMASALNATSPDPALEFSMYQTQVYQALSSSQHLTGGAPLGSREKGGVADETLKVYGTENVYICDGSMFPYQPSAHPMGVTYALALRAARLFQGSQLTESLQPAANDSGTATASFPAPSTPARV